MGIMVEDQFAPALSSGIGARRADEAKRYVLNIFRRWEPSRLPELDYEGFGLKPEFFGNAGRENLELESLERRLMGDTDDRQGTRRGVDRNPLEWGSTGPCLLNYFMRDPLTKPAAIQYVQDGVKELSERPDMRDGLARIFVDNDGVFISSNILLNRRSTMERTTSLGSHKTAAEKVAYAIRDAKSDCIRDIAGSMRRLLDNEHLSAASAIANRKVHDIKITMKNVRSRHRPEQKASGYSIAYDLEGGKQIECFEFSDELVDAGYGRSREEGYVNAYEIIWEAIKESLEKSGFEALDSIAFDGAALGYLNGLAGLCKTYEKSGIKYTFPKIKSDGKRELYFREAVHPLLAGAGGQPIPNDINLNETPSMYVVAGANNGGKTTFLKITGLLTLMSHMGGPVPASEARVSPVRHTYTHFPKSESVLSGDGKFVDELKRLRYIAEHATKYDLVLLDEPCGGTSNEDAIEASMDMVYILHKIGCPTIYSTHLHEMQSRIGGGKYPNAMNLYVETKGTEDDPVFTHLIRPGIAGKSYGRAYSRKILPVDEILRKRGLT